MPESGAECFTANHVLNVGQPEGYTLDAMVGMRPLTRWQGTLNDIPPNSKVNYLQI